MGVGRDLKTRHWNGHIPSSLVPFIQPSFSNQRIKELQRERPLGACALASDRYQTLLWQVVTLICIHSWMNGTHHLPAKTSLFMEHFKEGESSSLYWIKTFSISVIFTLFLRTMQDYSTISSKTVFQGSQRKIIIRCPSAILVHQCSLFTLVKHLSFLLFSLTSLASCLDVLIFGCQGPSLSSKPRTELNNTDGRNAGLAIPLLSGH